MDTTRSGKWQVRFVVACSMIALGCAAWTNALPAQQQQQQPPRRSSVDLGTGFFRGVGGGARHNRNGLGAEVQVTTRARTSGPTSVLLAVNVSAFVVPDMTDDCVIPRDANGEYTGACLPNFPDGAGMSVLAGIEQQLGGEVSLRFLAGPSLFTTNTSSGRMGVQTRADLAVPANKHAAFLLWGQHGFMPLKGQPRARVPMVGAGIRLQ